MKKVLYVIFLTTIFVSCNMKRQKELIFLQKNAYDHPVWEEMLQQDRIKFADVVKAFNAYASNHVLDEETVEHFEKLEKRIEESLDSDGYYVSEVGHYKNLMAYRNPVPGNEAPLTKSGTLPSSYTKEVPNKGNLGHWKNIGPFGNPDVHWSATGNGAVEHIEIHPTNPAIMLASTRNGGLWKTVNYGKNWTPETDHFATDNTSCVEICPANPSVLYLGTGEDEKIYYSEDFGINWEDRSIGLSGKIYDVHSDPGDKTRVIAATASGIYLTTNSGMTWTKKLSGRYTDVDLIDNWDLMVVSCDDADILPVLHFSNDKGDNFIEKRIITHLDQVDRFYVGIHKPDQGAIIVYAYGLVDGNAPTRFIGLWKSEYNPSPDDGSSYFNFTEVKHPTYAYPNGPVPLAKAYNVDGFTAETSDYYGSINPYTQGTWVSDFYVSPTNPMRLLLFREKFWGSEDGGIIWDVKPSYGASNWADNRYVTTNMAKDTVFWCNDGGIWAIKEDDLFPSESEVAASGMSKNNYINSKVVSKNGDICISEGSQMDVSLMNKGVFMTGGQDIGQVFSRNGRTSHVASADVYRGRIKPEDDTKFITGELVVKLKGSGTSAFAVYNNIEPDHFNKKRLYGFTRKNKTENISDVRLVRSPADEDGWLVNNFKGEDNANSSGHSWIPVYDEWTTIPTASVGISKLNPGTFEQSRANAELAFLGDEVGWRLFYTENLSAESPDWIELNNAPRASHYRIATHQYNENMIVLATNSGVYVSKDKGQTWNLRGNFPENNPNLVLIDKNTSEGIYVMTTLTVYYIDETLTEWQEFNKGLPLQNLSDMRIAYYPNNDNRLYVSKYGRGVWFSSLQSVLDANEDKPVAAFAIHGMSNESIVSGESVKLLDQSSNATDLHWTFENGADVIHISDTPSPQVTLSTPGYYKVSLEAGNTNGTSVLTKDHYIKVNPKVVPKCKPDLEYSLDWYQRIREISINNNSVYTIWADNYIEIDKIFEVKSAEQAEFYYEDNYSGYNFYAKVWIDFNNDGDLSDSEEVATSGGQVENFTAHFDIPNSAVLNEPLLMRVAAIDSQEPPSSCNDVNTDKKRQTIDFKIKIVDSSVSFNSSHYSTTVNGSVLSTSYSGAKNVQKAGFVYSTFNGDLNMDNSNVVVYESATPIEASGTYATDITDLEYNAIYYYRPFIRDESGICYGEMNSFHLQPYNIPMAESLSSTKAKGNEWMLKGRVFPEGNSIDELSIEYGCGNFNNRVDLDPAAYPSSDFVFEALVTPTEANLYQYRVKLVIDGKAYYSNVKTFKVDSFIGIGQVSETDIAVNLYPNPVKDEVYVSVEDAEGKEFVIEVLNSNGKLMDTDKRIFSPAAQRIDVRKYPSGLYFLRLSDQKTAVTLKFVKQ